MFNTWGSATARGYFARVSKDNFATFDEIVPPTSYTVANTLEAVSVRFPAAYKGLTAADTVEVRIYKYTGQTSSNRICNFDDIIVLGTLTSAVVPEPASLGVLALGAAGLLLRRRR